MATVNIGTIAKRVNASKGTLLITNTDTGEYFFLQDVQLGMTHVEYREPTTSGGPIYYSGQQANRLSGTLLYSTDAWRTANIGIGALLTRTNGEVPVITLAFKLTAADGTSDTFTWTNLAKCEGITPQHSPEGAIKFSISFILIGEPNVTFT